MIPFTPHGTRWFVLVSCVVTLLLLEIALRIFLAARSMTIVQFQPSFVTAQPVGPQFDRRRFISQPFLPYGAAPK